MSCLGGKRRLFHLVPAAPALVRYLARNVVWLVQNRFREEHVQTQLILYQGVSRHLVDELLQQGR